MIEVLHVARRHEGEVGAVVLGRDLDRLAGAREQLVRHRIDHRDVVRELVAHEHQPRGVDGDALRAHADLEPRQELIVLHHRDLVARRHDVAAERDVDVGHVVDRQHLDVGRVAAERNLVGALAIARIGDEAARAAEELGQGAQLVQLLRRRHGHCRRLEVGVGHRDVVLLNAAVLGARRELVERRQRAAHVRRRGRRWWRCRGRRRRRAGRAAADTAGSAGVGVVSVVGVAGIEAAGGAERPTKHDDSQERGAHVRYLHPGSA